MTNECITSGHTRRRRSRPGGPPVATLLAWTLLFAVALFLPTAASAQDVAQSDDAVDEDALFGGAGDADTEDDGSLFGAGEDELFGGELIEQAPEDEASATAGVEDLLTSEVAKVGGRFDFSVSISADPEAIESIDDIDASYTLSPTVYVDSRPDADFRVFIKTGLAYTTASAEGGGSGGASLNVEELFSDVTLSDWLYLRAGKQKMAWGVGYFFSPADLVSLEAIDPDEPESDLEGPVAVRLHLPYKTTNAYAYAMLDDLPDGGSAGWAGKIEFVLGPAELTAGGYYEEGSVSGVMGTLSAGIWDFDVFAEAVAQYGSTFAMVSEEGPALVTDLRSDTWFALATAGARYNWSDDYDNFDLTFLGQYYFNGEGYEDLSILQDDRIPMLIGAGELAPADLLGTGRHYAAANLRWNQSFGTDLSPSVFWIGNLSDGSGRVSLDLRYTLGDFVSFTPGYTYTYGDEGEEYAPGGDGHQLSLGVSMGQGAF